MMDTKSKLMSGVASDLSDENSSKHFICGAGSSLVNIAITFPVNKIMFRQQLYGFRTHNALRQIAREGLLNLYRGLIPPMLQKSTSTALMFGLFNHTHHKMISEMGFGNMTATLLASLFAGGCEGLLSPFERIQTLLMDTKHHNTFRNSYHAFTSLHSRYGMKEYFRGTTAILLRNGPSTYIYFSLRGPLKEILPHADKNTFQNSLNDFVSGAFIGAGCSSLFYPVNVVKTRMQSNLGGEFMSFSSTWKIVWKERNKQLRKLYRGVHINFIRSFLSWGIINTSYEYLMEIFY